MQPVLHTIDVLKDELQSLLPMKPEYQQKLDKKFRLEFNYNSNHIEGNTLTYGETELLLVFGQTKGDHDKREYDEMEAHDVAFQLIKEWAADKDRPLTERDIKNLNETILVKPFWKDAITPDGQNTRRLIKVGDYKEYPNSVRLQNGEIFHYASPTDTPIQMGELMEWYRTEEEKKELHPVALAAMLHYRFVRIHPFDDGNGRISRLLMNYVLLRNNYPPIIIKSDDKKNYLNALHQADAGYLEEFINYIVTQVEWSLDISIKAARGKNINESTDIDKEIALFKQKVNAVENSKIRKNDELIYKLFITTIRPLFIKFEEKHNQFKELFQESILLYSVNDKVHIGLEWLSENIFRAELCLSKKNTFEKVAISIQYNKYKYGPNKFSMSSTLFISFEHNSYIIKHNQKTLREVKYNNELDIDELIAECIKDTFEIIKSISKQQ